MARALPSAAVLVALMFGVIPAAYAQGSPSDNQNPPAGNNQNPPSGNPAANNQGSPASSQAVASFLANTAALLSRNPDGGGTMVSEVRDLVTGDLGTVSALLALAPRATLDQRIAIGTGLGLAALILVRSNPQAGTTIQNAILSLADVSLTQAYAAVTGNQNIAAAGPGGGGGGSAGAGESATGGSTPNGGITGASVFAPNYATTNVADAFTTPGFTTSGAGSTTFTITTVSTVVSATTP